MATTVGTDSVEVTATGGDFMLAFNILSAGLNQQFPAECCERWSGSSTCRQTAVTLNRSQSSSTCRALSFAACTLRSPLRSKTA